MIFLARPVLCWLENLKTLKKDLKLWNDEDFGKIDDQRKTLFKELSRFDEKEIIGIFTDEEKVSKITVMADLEKLSFRRDL